MTFLSTTPPSRSGLGYTRSKASVPHCTARRFPLQQAATEPFGEKAEVTNRTNYFATKAVCQALFPLLAPGARVVNVASRAGTMVLKKLGPEMASKFTGAKSEAEIDALLNDFIRRAKDGSFAEVRSEIVCVTYPYPVGSGRYPSN